MGKRVMIVDDAAFIREVLAEILVKRGFELVAEAVDGEEAVQKAIQLKPDTIIMDIVMPVKSGLQAAKEILALLPQTKIVACSTEGNETMVLKAIEVGCVDFLIKPFKVDDIDRVMKKIS
jgi:two-component system chemotaxis response regulator CheY